MLVQVPGSRSLVVYRVGLGRDLALLRIAVRYGQWSGVRWRLRIMLASARRRSWWGFWQAEWDGCRRAPRGLTARRARRKALRQLYARAMYVAPSRETRA